jgi:hypothetical protein
VTIGVSWAVRWRTAEFGDQVIIVVLDEALCAFDSAAPDDTLNVMRAFLLVLEPSG